MQVSLITCTNNSEKTIKDCCQSISFQTYDNIEHIIIDKSSQDRTIPIIQENKKKKSRYFNRKLLAFMGHSMKL